MARRLVIAAAGLLVLAAGCSSPHPSGGSRGQLTGTQLAAALLPAADFPSGYQASAHLDSGGGLEESSGPRGVITMTCSGYNSFIDPHVDGWDETAFASATDAEAVSVSGNEMAPFRGFDQLVSQFANALAAAAYFTALRPVFTGCRPNRLPGGSFDSQTADTHVGGRHAFVTWTKMTASGSMMVQSTEWRTLVAVDGPDVFFLTARAVNTAMPVAPTLTDLMVKLIASVRDQR